MDPETLFPWLMGASTVVIILTVIGSVICTVVPLVAIFGGVFMLIRRSSQRADAINTAALRWPSTTGTIVKSRVEVSGGEHTSVMPRIIYQYEVGGTTYQSDRIRAGDVHLRGGLTSREAYDTVDRYPEGAAVTVYYNPANPAESALER